MVHDEFEIYKGIILGWSDLAKEVEDSQKPVEKNIEEQEFLLTYTKAILRTSDATDQDYKRVAFGLLLDLAIISLCQQSPRDDKGKYVYDPAHEYLIESTRFMIELSRQRRCVYGEQWFMSGSKSAKTGELHYSHGYSPMRGKLYIFVSMPKVTEDHVNSFVNSEALVIMSKYGTKRCVVYAASTANILFTYEYLKKLVFGQAEVSDMEEEYILDTKCAFIGK